MSVRITRVKRLLAVESSRVATRELELVEARRELELREAAVTRLEAEHAEACDRSLEVASVEDLERASDHRAAIHEHIVRARAAVDVAQAEVHTREAAAIRARTAERRMEILLEGFVEVDALRATKAERKSADEHAARHSTSRGVNR